MEMNTVRTLFVWGADHTTANCLHDVAFGMIIAGLGGIWIGGGNYVTRRFIARRWGPLGSKHAFWMRKGFFFAPDWLSVPILAAGCVSLSVGALLWLMTLVTA